MTLVQWNDPFRELARLQHEVGRVFSGAYDRADDGLLTSGSWVPAVDIYESGDHELILKAELPDVSREAIDVAVDNGTLTIKGERKPAADVKEEAFHRIERRFGPFSRSFALPRTVDASKVVAGYKDGILTVRLPLRDEAKRRQIRVEVAA